MANLGWLGEGDTNHAEFPTASLLYFGTQKTLGWLGEHDTSHAEFPASSLLYSGTLKTLGWLGEHDSSNAWIPSALIYAIDLATTGVNPGFTPSVSDHPLPILSNGYLGLTWMKTLYILTRDLWPDGLANPYVGQEWPVPNTGGAQSGQTFPY
jgi:hypothetical protein